MTKITSLGIALFFAYPVAGLAQPLITNPATLYPPVVFVAPIPSVTSPLDKFTATQLDPKNAFLQVQQFAPLSPPFVNGPGDTLNTLQTNKFVNLGDLFGSFQQRIDLAFAQLQTRAQYLQNGITQADRGIAATAAMANVWMPSAPGRTTWAVNGAAFQSEIGAGLSMAHRLNLSTPVAITAAYGNGGGTAHVGRVGLMGEF
jgi:hypothetical protein